MRKLLCFVLLTAWGAVAVSQEAPARVFKPFKVELSTGYAIPSGSGSKGGILLSLEPRFAASNQFTLGLRLETAMTARAMEGADGSFVTGDVKGMGSYMATGDYFFNTKSFRPFVGAGMGLVSVAATSFEEGTEFNDPSLEIGYKTGFGFVPRIGFEYGHFKTGLEYNVMGKTGSMNNNYMSIKAGFFFGGGRNK